MSRLLWCIAFYFSLNGLHAEMLQELPKGFHWYTAEPVQKPAPKTPPAPAAVKSPYERLMAMRQETLNKLAQALLEPSFNATHDYMKAQMAYSKNNQQFVRYWQQVLLMHPELDSSLNFPTDNTAIAVRNDAQKLLINKVIHESSARYGFLLFYRGTSSISQKFVMHLLPFIKEYGFSMISVSTDGQLIEGLPNPKSIPLEVIQKQMAIEAKYMPALYFVDLKSNRMSPVSYGFLSLEEIKERIFDVMTQFKRLSYEGVSE
ncbi:putative conjugative transfer protein TraF [Legionella birminghamensis]|uniref:Conjugative transfer protein TraF n=1 Tax=Legionella birminghamensis TaxID=28083 RepID=A0A378JU55_9GAMM|nr:type-F conjugative transfer system pilin assembly protein TraF [Legionella birminghamensis]KTC69796.1 putative conjugative transfer protein TraF [Legionella birminghamensis]STX60932.1 putative conjugative transfer protein TraF [Legionella birminghamensis]